MLPKLCERGYEMGKAKKVESKGTATAPKVAKGTGTVVNVPTNKRAQCIALVAFAKANNIQASLLPGLLFVYSTIMQRRHGDSAKRIKNALGECRRYPTCYLAGQYTANTGDMAVATAWVKGLGITASKASDAQKLYVQAKADSKAAMAKAAQVAASK